MEELPDIQAAISLFYDLRSQGARTRSACQKRHFAGSAGDAVAKAVKAPCGEAARLPGSQGSGRPWGLAQGRAGLRCPALAVARHGGLWVPRQVHTDLQRILTITIFALTVPSAPGMSPSATIHQHYNHTCTSDGCCVWCYWST